MYYNIKKFVYSKYKQLKKIILEFKIFNDYKTSIFTVCFSIIIPFLPVIWGKLLKKIGSIFFEKNYSPYQTPKINNL